MSWPQPTISGYNATPPADDGSQTASNVVAWATILGKIGNPLKTLLETTIGSIPPYLVPTGAIQAFAGSVAPPGWLLCFGQAVSRSTYADLFSVIGTTYGTGDGATTFNVPDLRDRIPLGKADMGGSDAARISLFDSTTLGGVGGAETLPEHAHGLNSHTHDMASHTHTGGSHSHGVNDPGHSHAVTAVPGAALSVVAGGTNNNAPQPVTSIGTTVGFTGINLAVGGAVATSGPSTNSTGTATGNTTSFGIGTHGVLQLRLW